MSLREEKLLSLASTDFAGKSMDNLRTLYGKQLKEGVHGMCFSPYMEGQQPGDHLSEDQIRKRLEIIKPHSKWVRSFSTTEGNELIPIIAKELGMKTLVGAWLGDDQTINRQETDNLIGLINDEYVDIASVGNEVMYRGDMTEEELLQYMRYVKSSLRRDTPVGYVDAYYEFEDRPAIAAMCDVILANCYPFWEGCSREYSLLYMKEMYRTALRAGNGKRVIITETGWPDQGSSLKDSHPSVENAMKYFLHAQDWSKEEDIELFYFSSFDESWKVGAEGDVGAYWGIWDKDEKLKFC